MGKKKKSSSSPKESNTKSIRKCARLKKLLALEDHRSSENPPSPTASHCSTNYSMDLQHVYEIIQATGSCPSPSSLARISAKLTKQNSNLNMEEHGSHTSSITTKEAGKLQSNTPTSDTYIYSSPHLDFPSQNGTHSPPHVLRNTNISSFQNLEALGVDLVEENSAMAKKLEEDDNFSHDNDPFSISGNAFLSHQKATLSTYPFGHSSHKMNSQHHVLSPSSLGRNPSSTPPSNSVKLVKNTTRRTQPLNFPSFNQNYFENVAHGSKPPSFSAKTTHHTPHALDDMESYPPLPTKHAMPTPLPSKHTFPKNHHLDRNQIQSQPLPSNPSLANAYSKPKQRAKFLPSSSPPTSNWKGLFASNMSTPLKLKSFPFKIINGKRVVDEPPLNIYQEGIDYWQNCLVGQFIGPPPPMFLIKTYLIDFAWRSYGRVEVKTNGKGLFIFKLENEAKCSEILGRLWHVNHRPLLLRKWDPNMDVVNLSYDQVPIWVKLRNVPLSLWSNDGLSYISSHIGEPLQMDAVTESRNNLEFARVCIEVNLEYELPDSVEVKLQNGKLAKIDIEYAWKPLKCSLCNIVGHTFDSCPTRENPSTEIANVSQKNNIPIKIEQRKEWKQVVKGNRLVPSKESNPTLKDGSNNALDENKYNALAKKEDCEVHASSEEIVEENALENATGIKQCNGIERDCVVGAEKTQIEGKKKDDREGRKENPRMNSKSTSQA